MRRSVRLCVSTIAVIVLVGIDQLRASPTGSITGFPKDPTGAFVPGVKIILTSTATNAQLTTMTNDSGAYQFPQLPPATYSLVAEAAGFKRASIARVLVEVDQITRADIALEIGNLTQVVEVASAATLLEADKSTLSHVVDNRTIVSVPLNARQFLDLALLTPGVSPAAAGALGGFSVAGARSQSNIFLVDGISNLDTALDTPLDNFRITDAVQEFAVQTSVALPEFGRGIGGHAGRVPKRASTPISPSACAYFLNKSPSTASFFSPTPGRL